MIEIIQSICDLGTLACEIVAVVILWRAVSKFRVGDINVWGERRNAPVDSESTGFSKSKNSVESRVDQLPPEIIAPNIKTPPRPKGGFGSRVGKDDGGS